MGKVAGRASTVLIAFMSKAKYPRYLEIAEQLVQSIREKPMTKDLLPETSIFEPACVGGHDVMFHIGASLVGFMCILCLRGGCDQTERRASPAHARSVR